MSGFNRWSQYRMEKLRASLPEPNGVALPPRYTKARRNLKLYEDCLDGMSATELAAKYGISKQRALVVIHDVKRAIVATG